MSSHTTAIGPRSKSRHPSALSRAVRSIFEPLEERTLLSVSPGGGPGLLHHHHLIKNDINPTASHHAGRSLAYTTVENPRLPAGNSKTPASPLALNNGTPIAIALTPSQIQQAYGFSNITLPDGSPATGAGITIGIVDAYHNPNIQSDLHVFDQQYFSGVDPLFTQVNLGTSTNIDVSGGWEGEEALDVEWAHAIAPQANILLVEAASASTTDMLAAVDKAVSLGANVVSMSWAHGEPTNETSLDSHFQTPNVAFVASSGDGGWAEWPSTSPFVLGVGGTSLALDANNNWSSEVGWYNSGGGISAYEPRPSSQPTTYTDGSTTGIPLTNRGIPDVAYNASSTSAVSIYDSYPSSNPNRYSGSIAGWNRSSGTSAGAPQWAALIALADQGRIQSGLSPLGTPAVLSTLYSNPADFHDIVTGSSLKAGGPQSNPGVGYDLVTGLGTPQAPLVVSSLIGIAPTAPPASPNGLSAIPGDNLVSLRWNATSGASSWNLYRSTDGVNYTLYQNLPGTSFVDSSVTNGAIYSYVVTAVNALGESAPTAAISATPQLPPAPPTSVSAGASYSSNFPGETVFAMTLNWAPSAGASTYTVLRSSISGSSYAVIASGVSGTSFVDPTVNAGTSYYYVIQAVNSAGATSAISTQATGTAYGAFAPTNLTATAGNNNIALAWGASTGATSYNVLRSTTNGSGYTLVASKITGTTYTDSKVTVGTTYYYVVQAVSTSGPSGNSNQASATAKHGK